MEERSSPRRRNACTVFATKMTQGEVVVGRAPQGQVVVDVLSRSSGYVIE